MRNASPIGLERIAEELMGRRKWKQYQESLTQSHATDLLVKQSPSIAIGESLSFAGDFFQEKRLDIQDDDIRALSSLYITTSLGFKVLTFFA